MVATGKTHSVLEFVQAAFAIVDLPWEKYLVSEHALETAARSRPGSSAIRPKARTVLGWESSVTFEELVREMVEADLRALRAN